MLWWLDGVEKKYIEESGAMNVFFLIDDKLATPFLEETLFEGLTRDTVIQLAKDCGVKVINLYLEPRLCQQTKALQHTVFPEPSLDL